jgi:hypothetical protein
MGLLGRRLALLALVIAAALAWPGSALAASGSLVNGVMDYQGGGDANRVTFQ